ncbi:MAG TPA: hypothetical protein VGM44_05725 [Polyangiaceae bacterium]
MRGWLRSLWTTHFTVDLRSLGLFRILFGAVLFSDLGRRWSELQFWYVNSGILPNHTLLWRPPAHSMFSLFFTVSSAPEAELGFFLSAVVYGCFMLGYRTRWAQLFTVLVRVSLNSRLAVLENGGDMVMDLLCLFTLPLPLGARFSFDAVAASLAAERAPQKELELETPREPAPTSYASLAVFGLLLQFSAVYLFNASAKTGAAWHDGSAVYYALHQDKLVTWAGVWMREHLSEKAIRWLTWSTLGTEWVAWVLIITPFFVPVARTLAVCVLPFLHLGFALGLNLGGFSIAMMSFYALLLTPGHWRTLERWLGPRVCRISNPIEQRLRRVLEPRPFAPWSGVARMLGEVATLLLILAIASEALNDNIAVPQALRVHQPKWAKAIIEYPRILQGWRMFSSEPSRVDSMIYVDAVTADGRHVDPYNAVASDQPFPASNVVPTHMGQSQFFVMYSDRIPYDGYAAYRQAFSEWLEAYPERTGHQQDCLMSYDVFLITDQTPPFGSHAKPTPLTRQRFMSYVAPFDSACRKQHGKKIASVGRANGG